MVFSRIYPMVKLSTGRWSNCHNFKTTRMATTSKSGGVLPEPHKTSFGLLRITLTVIPGLLIGAAISKHIANFLEENDLFVPSDDDDDDD
ncbi:DDDD domain containing protein [Asbolus verrucosus]|uniref:Essential MCU regulator, mitochondrial n=1 Tax=Asbolus verrucosus TaxID=1661398 RepID=A0A482VNK0_ASBVE|nr:DDDD domain containing protein [Asbolus verrucosus]